MGERREQGGLEGRKISSRGDDYTCAHLVSSLIAMVMTATSAVIKDDRVERRRLAG